MIGRLLAQLGRQPDCDHCPHKAEADHWRHIANERQAALDRYAAIAPIPDPYPDDEGDQEGVA